jgi:succinoglycan biosynthesis transport protein ExoP
VEAAQVSPQSDALQDILDKERQARVNLAHLKQVYGPKYPEVREATAEVNELHGQVEAITKQIQTRSEIAYKQAVNREQMLGKAVASSKSEFDRLNARSFEYQQLMREAEGDRKLYEDLVRRIREASINTGFQNNSIRIADAARPAARPVFPRTALFVALAFVLSTCLATGTVMVYEHVDDTLTEPEEVARAFGARVLGTLPRVKLWNNQEPQLLVVNGDAEIEGSELPQIQATDEKTGETGIRYRESIRSLRKAILHDRFTPRIKVVLITSAMPAEGKSMAAAHLALSYAAQGKRVLLIDADLRRPTLHRLFNFPNSEGLASVLFGQNYWRDVRRTAAEASTLDVIPAGPVSRRAWDLVDRTQLIFEEAAPEYDLIIIDSPPLLGFAEPMELAPSVDGVVVITRAGQTNRRSLGEALVRLTEIRANILGVILNGFTPSHAGDYQKHYRIYKEPSTVQVPANSNY